MINRRRFLQGAAGSLAAVAGGRLLGSAPEPALAAGNVIMDENRLSDPATWTGGFQLHAFGANPGYDSVVGGFANQTSVNVGGSLDIFLTRFDAGPNMGARLDVYRLGYYGANRGRLVQSIPNVSFRHSSEGADLTYPPDQFGLRKARPGSDWPATRTLSGPATAVTGVYVVKLTTSDGKETHIPYIVRDDARARAVLVVMPTNTWQAYNNLGGYSLYYFNSASPPGLPATVAGTDPSGHTRGVKVSFDRPYANQYNDFDWVLRTSFPAIYWLERQGYDLAYTDDLGLHHGDTNGQLVTGKTKTLVLTGHSEYWTQEMLDNVRAARDAGVNILSLSANTAYWKVRLEDSDRTLVCFKTVEGSGSSGTGNAGFNDYGPNQTARPSAVDPLGTDGARGGATDHPEYSTTTFRDPGAAAGSQAPSGPNTGTGPGSGRVGPGTPENSVFGVLYVGDDDPDSFGLDIPAGNGSGGEFAAHPAWRNTKVATQGRTRVGSNIVGWEWDGIPGGQGPYVEAARVQPGGAKRLSETDPRTAPSDTGNRDLSYIQDYGRLRSATPPAGQGPTHAITYRAASGALVFAAGTMQWAFGLGPHYMDRLYRPGTQIRTTYADPVKDDSDSDIQQATYNLLSDTGVQPTTPEGIILDGSTTPAPSPTPTPTPTPIPTPTLIPAPRRKSRKPKIATGTRRLSSRSAVPVAITSPGDVVNGWKGTLRLESAKAFQVTAHKRRRRLALGRKGFDVRAARTMVVEVKISKSNRHLLTRLGHLDVTATAVAKDGNGDGVTVSATFRLRPPARRRRKSRR